MRNDFLYRLIHVLDQGELRVCRNELALDCSSVGKFRLLIFESLAAQNEYDWDALCDAVSKNRMRSQLSVEKTRLQDMLLAVLHSVRRNREGERCPWVKFEDARILLGLGLLENAAEMATEGIGLAVAMEDVYSELQLRELLREIYKSLDRKALQTRIMDNDQRLEVVVEKVQNLNAYTLINDRMLDYHLRNRVVNDEQVNNGVAMLMSKDEMSSIDMALSLPAQLCYYFILVVYNRMMKRTEEAIISSRKVLELWDSNPCRKQYYAHLYRRALANLIGLLTITDCHDEVSELLQEMEKTSESGHRSKVLRFCDVELQHQLYYMNTGRLEGVFAREQVVTAGLSKYGKAIGESYMITLIYNLAVAHLLNDNLGKALHYYNRIRELGICSERMDLQGIARLFRLALLMLDTSNVNFQHYLRNSKRFFDRNHRLHPMEELMYDWIVRHSKLKGKTEMTSSYEWLYAELLPFEAKRDLGAMEFRLFAHSMATNQNIRHLFDATMKRGNVVV